MLVQGFNTAHGKKKKGGRAEQRRPKKPGFVSELDSLQYTLIVWFFCIYTNPPTFEARMLKSHLPMQHTASAKLELSSKSHLSRVPLKTNCTPAQHKLKKKKSFRETDVWVEHSKWRYREPSSSSCRRCMTTAAPSLENKRLCNTGSLLDRKASARIPKVCYCNSEPTWGWYQPPVLSRQNAVDPFTKKVSKNMLQSSCTMGLIEKPYGMAKGWGLCGVKFLIHSTRNESGCWN